MSFIQGTRESGVKLKNKEENNNNKEGRKRIKGGLMERREGSDSNSVTTTRGMTLSDIIWGDSGYGQTNPHISSNL